MVLNYEEKPASAYEAGGHSNTYGHRFREVCGGNRGRLPLGRFRANRDSTVTCAPRWFNALEELSTAAQARNYRPEPCNRHPEVLRRISRPLLKRREILRNTSV
jgi:hypothetical protein